MCEKCFDRDDRDSEPSWALYDARGIYVSRVCKFCVKKIKSQYRPEIFTDSDYETSEPIDED